MLYSVVFCKRPLSWELTLVFSRMENTERRILLGQAVRRAREERNISQRQLALMIGNESHANLSKIESGQVNVKFDTICSIADALDVEVSYFYEGF